MKVQQPFSVLRIMFLALAILTVSACGDTAALVRRVTYPPDFQYVTGQELRSSMDRLAFQLQRLDQALEESNIRQANQQQEVLGILRNIERVGANLQAGEAGSNHPFLQDHMRDFVGSVSQARTAVSRNPPRYYLAGRVAGGCVNCHKINR
ncbi:MAG: hypothetical protein JKY98_07040 [Gammaproteobacteria bacterium]|nr:hypothetical protein [Gammaproteobacteria bacterium]